MSYEYSPFEEPQSIVLTNHEIDYLMSCLDEEYDEGLIQIRDKIFHQVYSQDRLYKEKVNLS